MTATTGRTTVETMAETEITNSKPNTNRETRITQTGMTITKIETGMTITGLTTEGDQTNTNTTETNTKHKSSSNSQTKT